MQEFKDNGVFFGDLTDKNIGQLKILNQTVFPISYPDKFYESLLKPYVKTRLAYQSDVLVGAISYRLEPIPDSKEKSLYIMIFGVLEPYRNQGIGKDLVKHALEIATQNSVKYIHLHVQTNNEKAIQFYKKFNFKVGEKEEGYYKDANPTSAYKLIKEAPFTE